MSVKLVGDLPPPYIKVKDLPEGKIARIVKWGNNTDCKYIGDIVQRWGDNLVVIGETRCNSWPGWFDHNSLDPAEYLCEILPNGTTLKIENNG